MNNLTKETKLTLFYILIAFAFSVALRMIWVYKFGSYEQFFYNGQFMINTNDGYLWAEGARDILSGVHQPHDLSPVDSVVAKLTAFFATVLPFSFESIIFYMPVFLSSLVVIPIILIAKNLKNLEMGLIAALLASVTWSYYNRTMAGYYDTDMLNIVLPMFLLWSLILAIQTNKTRYLLFSGLSILAYSWWYSSGYSLIISFFGLVLLYTVIFDRKNIYNYKLLAIILFAMMNLYIVYKAVFLVCIFLVFLQKKYDRYLYYILALGVVAFFLTGGFNPILDQLKGYVFSSTIKDSNDAMGLHFVSVAQTVREAGHIPFEVFANRISGNIIIFWLSLVGYVWLLYKHRVMLLSLPMVGLGFLAYVGGLRFTIYAVPVMAMGVAFLISEVTAYITDKKSIKFFAYSVFAMLLIYPNYKHIEGYLVPTVFTKNEVKVLESLKQKAQREDYVVSWWDYGYPIRYYSDVKTLVDGGKHSGDVNFLASYILTKPQQEAAKMARLAVEYTEKKFALQDKNTTQTTELEMMSRDYGFDDAEDFLLSLQTDIKLPKKTRDVYLYLPYRMVDIYPTVLKFSNLNVMDGTIKGRHFYYITRNFKESKTAINLGSGIIFDKLNNTIHLQNQTLPLRRVVQTYYDKDMKFQKSVELINPQALISMIYLGAYNTFLLVDEDTYNSLYFQLMILEQYDKNLFEEVLMTPRVKVYRLK